MDALMAAFVAALLTQAGDRTAWLAALLGDRYRQPGLVIAGVAIAIAVTNVLGVFAGMLVAPILTPNARTLMLAVALVSAGSSALFRLKHPGAMEGWRLGALATALVGVLAQGVGDRMQFITAALAIDTALPWLAAVGATLGSMVIIVPAVLGGEAWRRALPMTAIRTGTGAVLIMAGLWSGLGALRLI
ncbi:MAG: TMEM165/GDT1 family protein [Sphingomonas sp.]|nr:TMEM165/GDT1 family protein [Sphingomonas sp.]